MKNQGSGGITCLTPLETPLVRHWLRRAWVLFAMWTLVENETDRSAQNKTNKELLV